MKLRFAIADAKFWASRYSYSRSDENLNTVVRKAVLGQGYFTRDQLLEVCRWKSPRATPKAEENEASYVEAVTKVAISALNEKLKIEALTLLDGVSWPVASVLLHYGVSDTYPIIDFRALWSLSSEIEPHQYDYPIWQEYVLTCRSLAKEANLSVREFDKALWQYSKSEQPDDEG